ncbi:MAG TPA: hypothetical protein VKY59_04650 [Spirillospora sp.]|nr:hypothetical protein [Spirillospora sp.]
MYEMQRRQAQIEEFRRKIEQAKRTNDRDIVRHLVSQMSTSGLIPYSIVPFINLVIFVSPGAALNMLSSSFEASARRMLR